MQGRFQMTPGTDKPLPLLMDQAMISARARVLTRPGVDVLRLWIDSASGGEYNRAPPAQQAGRLYAAALASSEMKDYKKARAEVQRLIALTAGDPAAARLARLLSAEIELAAGAAPAAAALVGPKAPDWVANHPKDGTAWRTLASLYGEADDPVSEIRADAEANVAILDYPAARDRFRAAQDLVRRAQRGEVPGVHVDDYEASILDTRTRQIDALIRQQADDDKKK
jgi:predicted Zn-dependent protease